MISLQFARRRVVDRCPPLPTEAVPVADALGRVLAQPLVARTDVPPFDNSAMDGFAVIAGPGRRSFRLVGESLAGTPATTRLDDASAVRISTGAALPPIADAVVPDEQAVVRGGAVEIQIDARPGLNVRFAGEDIQAGRTMLDAGSRLGPVELAVAIATGHGQLICHRRPRIALIATGSELRAPGDELAHGQIHDSNTTTLAALATQTGAVVVLCDRVGDDPPATRAALASALGAADLVLLSGGVSLGPQDHVRAALAALAADEEFSGVAVRPGRPAWFGTCAAIPVLALPGNPVAAIVVFLLLGRPAIAALAGRRPAALRTERARLAGPIQPNPDRTNIVGVTLHQTADRPLEATPSGPVSPHATSPLLALDALALVPPGDVRLERGSPLEIVRMSDPS